MQHTSQRESPLDIHSYKTLGEFIQVLEDWYKKIDDGLTPEEQSNLILAEKGPIFFEKISNTFESFNAEGKNRLIFHCYLADKYLYARQSRLDEERELLIQGNESAVEINKLTDEINTCNILRSFLVTMNNYIYKTLNGSEELDPSMLNDLVRTIEEPIKEKSKYFSELADSQTKVGEKYLLSFALDDFNKIFGQPTFITRVNQLFEIFDKMSNISGMMRYAYNTGKNFKTNHGKYFSPLHTQLIEINKKDISLQEKLKQLEQAVLDTYWQIRKNQGLLSSKLGDALEAFILSKDGLGLPYKYGKIGMVPHVIDDETVPDLSDIRKAQGQDFSLKVEEFFDQRGITLNNYMDRAKLKFNPQENLNPVATTPEEQARIRIILLDLAKKTSANAKALYPLLNPHAVKMARTQFPFTCAYQTLNIQLSPSHLKTKRTETIKKLMDELETIRLSDNLDPNAKRDALMTAVTKTYRHVRDTAHSQRWFSSQSNLADALAKFMKEEFNISKKEMSNNILTQIPALAHQKKNKR